jgi:hypothetical protein
MCMCLLPLWLTLNFTDLCICTCIYTPLRGVAPARTPQKQIVVSPCSQNKNIMRQNSYKSLFLLTF